jgi:hypothetical protein
MSGRKYDANVRTLVFRNKVRYQNATSFQNSIWKDAPSANPIRRWLKQFTGTGTILHRKGAGRPSISQDDVNGIQETWKSYVPRKAGNVEVV